MRKKTIKTVSIDMDLCVQLDAEKNASKVVNTLLRKHYEEKKRGE